MNHWNLANQGAELISVQYDDRGSWVQIDESISTPWLY